MKTTCMLLLGSLLFVSCKGSVTSEPSLATTNAELMIAADLHFDLWYDSSQPITKAQCKYDAQGYTIYCVQQNPELVENDVTKSLAETGYKCGSEPPVQIFRSAIEDFLGGPSTTKDSSRSLLFCGDTKRHHLPDASGKGLTRDALETKAMGQVVGLLTEKFNQENIFYVAGNHDGVDDEAFFDSKDPTNVAWAKALTDAGIVSGTAEQLAMFNECGYYTKAIPNTNTTVIIVNSMPWGLSGKPGEPNCRARQIAQINKDIDDPKNTGRNLFVASHYPLQDFGITNTARVSRYFVAHQHIQDIVPQNRAEKTTNVPALTSSSPSMRPSYIKVDLTADPTVSKLSKNANMRQWNCSDTNGSWGPSS